jgi:transposase
VGENRRNRRKFTDEFKRDAVALVDSSGKPIAQIARELGI